MKHIWWFAFFVSSLVAHADDPFNALIWNRGNAMAENGQVDKGDWFEWWYYKVIDPNTQQAYFFTYGVINPWDKDATSATNSAVLQVGDFSRQVLISQRYPLTKFSSSYETTLVNIDDNQATDRHLRGHIQDELGHRFEWDLSLQKVWGFNAMGWTMSIPDASNIYWYPAQAAATMTGWIKTDEKTIEFKDAPAYQDRNWGRSFPKWWTWLTANGFDGSPDTILAAGGGAPKIFGSIDLKGGLGIGLLYKGEEYAFRTCDLDQFDLDIHWGKWSVVAENHRGQRIEIEAYAPPEKFFDIPFFSPHGERFHDYETLTGHMTVRILRWDFFSGWNPVTTLETDSAGVEWGSPEPVPSMGLLNHTELFNSTQRLQPSTF